MPAFGVTPAVSLYFAIHYVESPVSAHAGVARTVRTALAAVVLGYLAPVLWALARFGHVAPSWSSVWAWLTFPVLLPATHELLTASFGSSRTDVHCPHHLETHFAADLPFIRTAVYGVAGFCTVAHAWLVLRTIPDWIPGFMDHGHRPDTLDATTIDYLALLLVSFTWLTLLFGDLKRAGLVRAGWLQLVLLTVASTLVVGPGTVLVLGWLIREEALVASHAP